MTINRDAGICRAGSRGGFPPVNCHIQTAGYLNDRHPALLRMAMLAWMVFTLFVIATSAPAADPATLDPAAGRKVYMGKCARCHKLYDPAAYNERAWNTWLGKMREKARLNDEQFAQLAAYAQTVRPREAK